MAGRETVGEAWVKIHADGTGFDEEVRRDIDKAEPTFEKGGEQHGKAYIRGLHKTDRDRKGFFANLRADLQKTFKDSEKIGDRIGRMFGKGSRNDFINIIGGMVGGLGTLAVAIGKLIAGPFTTLFKTFGQVRDAGGGIGQALGSSLAQGAVGIAVAVAAVVAAAEALTAALGVIGSAVVLLSGLILALAGSIGFALVGALVAAAGALVPFAAAFGVFALALTSPNIGKQLKSLKDDLSDLSELAAQNIFGKHGEGVRALGDVLSAVRPVVDSVSSALGGLVQWLGEAARSKGFTDMMNNIARAIGPMITQIGKIGGNLATFLGEAFLAAEPIINEFLGWLDGITRKMAGFGKGGKNSGLAKFFEDAWASAKTVGALIWEIIGLVADLLSGGRQTGDNIFTKITKWVQDIRKWLADPANQKTLQQWWKDAETLGDKLGEIVVNVGKFIDALDTPENRKILLTILDIISKIAYFAGLAADNVGKINHQVGESGTSFKDSFPRGGFQEIWDGFIGSIAPSWDSLMADLGRSWNAMWSGIGQSAAGFLGPVWTGVKQGVSDAIGQIGIMWNEAWSSFSENWNSIWQSAAEPVNTVITTIEGYWTSFVDWLVGHSLIPDLIDEIVRLFTGLPGRIVGAIGNLGSTFAQWGSGVITQIGRIITQIVSAFGGLAQKAITKAGSLASQFAIWVSTLPGKARVLVNTVITAFANLARKIITRAGSLASQFAGWVASLPGKARQIVGQVVNAFAGLAQKAINRAGSIAGAFGRWVAALPGRARGVANDIASAFSGLAHKAIQRAGSLTSQIASWASGVYSRARGVADDIVRAFRGLAGRIVDAIGTIIPRIKMPSIPRPVVDAIVRVKDVLTASGGVFETPQVRVIGEAGPEAVVPLNRPLSQVDPSVRALSALAQGKLQAKNEGVRTGRTIEVGQIQVITPTEDPRAVASEVVARMAAAAYL